MKTSDKLHLPLGARIKINSTGTLGVIVDGPDKKGFYQISVGSLKMRVRAEDMTQLPAEKRKQRKQPQSPLGRSFQESSNEVLRLDLHGYTRSSALVAVEELVDRALQVNISRLEIIHGLGTGALKQVVHNYLSHCRHVCSFSVDSRNPGVTWVEL